MGGIVQDCSSRRGWAEIKIDSRTDPGVYYLVNIPPWDRDKDDSPICECPSYEYRGWCRHQAEALTQLCSWSELDGKEQTDEQRTNHICPECGLETGAVLIQ